MPKTPLAILLRVREAATDDAGPATPGREGRRCEAGRHHDIDTDGACGDEFDDGDVNETQPLLVGSAVGHYAAVNR